MLASIIEKETAKPEEYRLVSAVFHNRLRRGMPLQAALEEVRTFRRHARVTRV